MTYKSRDDLYKVIEMITEILETEDNGTACLNCGRRRVDKRMGEINCLNCSRHYLDNFIKETCHYDTR
jgi:hypothetical protein